jgi:hypothetical protein
MQSLLDEALLHSCTASLPPEALESADGDEDPSPENELKEVMSEYKELGNRRNRHSTRGASVFGVTSREECALRCNSDVSSTGRCVMFEWNQDAVPSLINGNKVARCKLLSENDYNSTAFVRAPASDRTNVYELKNWRAVETQNV